MLFCNCFTGRGILLEQKHWEFDSECPRCGKINHVSAPPGEVAVSVHCDHCTHGYDYIHIVKEHVEAEGEK